MTVEFRARRQAELDYAVLATWAGVQPDGTMTIVGANFLRVAQAAEPRQVAVAGRIRVYDESPSTVLRIAIQDPSGSRFEVADAIAPDKGADARYGDDRRQVLFALNTNVSVQTPGMFTIEVHLGDSRVRTLMFEVQARATET